MLFATREQLSLVQPELAIRRHDGPERLWITSCGARYHHKRDFAIRGFNCHQVVTPADEVLLVGHWMAMALTLGLAMRKRLTHERNHICKALIRNRVTGVMRIGELEGVRVWDHEPDPYAHKELEKFIMVGDVVPSIVYDVVVPGGRMQVCLKWLGCCGERCEPLLLPLCDADDRSWYGGPPEQFPVLFVGQVKDWPYMEALPLAYGAEAERYVVMVLHGPSGQQLAIYPPRVQIVKPGLGLLTPKYFVDFCGMPW
jgi:hypothetical protein